LEKIIFTNIDILLGMMIEKSQIRYLYSSVDEFSWKISKEEGSEVID